MLPWSLVSKMTFPKLQLGNYANDLDSSQVNTVEHR